MRELNMILKVITASLLVSFLSASDGLAFYPSDDEGDSAPAAQSALPTAQSTLQAETCGLNLALCTQVSQMDEGTKTHIRELMEYTGENFHSADDILTQETAPSEDAMMTGFIARCLVNINSQDVETLTPERFTEHSNAWTALEALASLYNHDLA
jgi:hypothetical protein